MITQRSLHVQAGQRSDDASGENASIIGTIMIVNHDVATN